MNHSQQSANGNLHTLYQNTTLLVKVSGKEILDPAFETFAQDLQRLIEEQRVRIVLVFGGGEQINQQWSKGHNEHRPMLNGMGITSDDVLKDGVLPAYNQIKAELQRQFTSLHIIDPQDVACDLYNEEYGLVGVPKNIELPDTDMSAVGFVGHVDQQPVNVNADDIALHIAQKHRTMNEAFFLTSSGGVYDINENIVPVITNGDIPAIMDNSHPYIKVEGGMLKKIQAVREMLPHIGKVAMVQLSDFLDELRSLKGRGTLIVDQTQLRTEKATGKDAMIYEAACEANRDRFKERNPNQMQQMRDNHFLLKIKNSALGGFSLVQHDDGSIEIARVWAEPAGNGMGKRIVESIVQHVQQQNIVLESVFAITRERGAANTFEKSGFSTQSLRALQLSNDPKMGDYLRNYQLADGEDRNVHFLKNSSDL